MERRGVEVEMMRRYVVNKTDGWKTTTRSLNKDRLKKSDGD